MNKRNTLTDIPPDWGATPLRAVPPTAFAVVQI